MDGLKHKNKRISPNSNETELNTYHQHGQAAPCIGPTNFQSDKESSWDGDLNQENDFKNQIPSNTLPDKELLLLEIREMEDRFNVRGEIIEQQKKEIEDQKRQILEQKRQMEELNKPTRLVPMLNDLINIIKEENIQNNPILEKIESSVFGILAKAIENEQKMGNIWKERNRMIQALSRDSKEANINAKEILNELKKRNNLFMKMESVLGFLNQFKDQEGNFIQKKTGNTFEDQFYSIEQDAKKTNYNHVNSNIGGSSFNIMHQSRSHMGSSPKQIHGIKLIIISNNNNYQYFEPIKHFLNKNDIYPSSNSLNTFTFNFERRDYISFLKSSEAKCKQTFVLYVIFCSGSRVINDTYKDELEALSKSCNVVLTFLIAGEITPPVVLDGYDKIVLNFHFSNGNIKETKVSEKSRDSLIEHIGNIIQD
ncbi:hypothetical protein ACTA71_005780 [Dictyostelium dimigraforme]